jgi:hypothetical protein
MRNAQILSGTIYVVFVSLSVRVFDALPGGVEETAILDVAGEITVVLVPLLVVAAVASQLSAAVADTAGGGEMLTGFSRATRSAGVGYLAVTGAATAVVWFADVFVIISLASRAFAAYYLINALMAVTVAARDRSIPMRRMRMMNYGALLLVLGFVVLFAVPADS